MFSFGPYSILQSNLPRAAAASASGLRMVWGRKGSWLSLWGGSRLILKGGNQKVWQEGLWGADGPAVCGPSVERLEAGIRHTLH